MMTSAAASAAEPELVAPDDPRVRIIGRSLNQGGQVHFDWPGVRIEFRMKGGGFKVLLRGTGPDFNVLVDGEQWTKLGTWGADGYDLWLPDGAEHTVTLIRRQGPSYGETIFAGIQPVPGAELLPLPPPKTRRVEFVGDSLTVGYGVEAVWTRCEDLRPYENAAKAYASLAADLMHAEPWLVAMSGHGVVRNFGETAAASPLAMPGRYPGALASDPSRVWAPEAPFDAAVIFLGTNDVSTPPGVEHAALVAGFHGLIAQVRARHSADLPIFLLQQGEVPAITTALRAVLAGTSNTHHLVLPSMGLDRGCDQHPGQRTQSRWAHLLATQMIEVLDW